MAGGGFIQFATIDFGIKAKQQVGTPALALQFATIDFGIKAKQPGQSQNREGEFATIDFGIKAKPGSYAPYMTKSLPLSILESRQSHISVIKRKLELNIFLNPHAFC